MTDSRLHRLRLWLDVGQYHRLETADDPAEWRWRPHDILKWAGLGLLCLVYGHQPERDHCMRPEHDRCRWCQKLMPGRAPRPAA